MKNSINAILQCLLLIAACQCSRPESIPLGTWKYGLLINGTEVGSAVTSNELRNGNYISTAEMVMKAGTVTNTTRQVIVETISFKPIKVEIRNEVINNDTIQTINTIADFKGPKGNEVELDTGEEKTSFTIDKPFVLDGNYFMSELIKKKFKNGAVIKSLIYEPSIEVEEPVLITVKVVGMEKTDVNGSKKKLLHLVQSIENFKTIDFYLDTEGIAHKVVINMLNNTIELVLKQ